MSIDKDKLEAIEYILKSESVIISKKVLSLYPTNEQLYTIICNGKRKNDDRDTKIKLYKEQRDLLANKLEEIEKISRRQEEE